MKMLSFTIMLVFAEMSWYTYAGQATTQIPITATVRPSPCVINGNQPINFNFGLMSPLKVNGVNYAQTKTVSVECDYFVNKPMVSISGSILPNGMTNVLATNINNFGVALYQGNSVDDASPLNISEAQAITKGFEGMNSMNGSFNITAVPYSKLGNSLNPGDFQAAAMINVYYQ